MLEDGDLSQVLLVCFPDLPSHQPCSPSSCKSDCMVLSDLRSTNGLPCSYSIIRILPMISIILSFSSRNSIRFVPDMPASLGFLRHPTICCRRVFDLLVPLPERSSPRYLHGFYFTSVRSLLKFHLLNKEFSHHPF